MNYIQIVVYAYELTVSFVFTRNEHRGSPFMKAYRVFLFNRTVGSVKNKYMDKGDYE